MTPRIDWKPTAFSVDVDLGDGTLVRGITGTDGYWYVKIGTKEALKDYLASDFASGHADDAELAKKITQGIIQTVFKYRRGIDSDTAAS